ELPPMTINEGDPILITGQLITEDGNPIDGGKIIVETFDARGNSIVSDATTEEDGVFLNEAYFMFSGESSVIATFEGDNEYASAESSMIFDVSVTGQEVQAAQEQQTTQESKPFFELPNIGGGCLIATATYGTELAPQVQMLREIRDNSVLGTQSGAAFMSTFNSFYYSFSPAVADLERQNPMFREIVRVAITPMISTLAILNYVDIDSEYEMLGYGIGVIMLNIGMYLILPALVMFRLAKLKHTKSVT
ncbi:MAG: CFI-box-CTERM domain-containing protein, partial [Thermoproteota archaeon]